MNVFPMRPEFELNHLKYFYFTVLDGKVGSAADRLHVQQPVVSKMIASLEERLGQPLFRKQGRRKVLTDYGQMVFRHCQVVFQELERLERFRKGPSHAAGPLNLGAVEPVAAHVLPEILSQLLIDFQGVHPNVYTATAAQLLRLIADRKLELGVFFHLPPVPEGVEVIQRIPVRFRLVVSARQKENRSVIESFIGSREIDDNSSHRFPTVERMRKDYPGVRIVFSANHLGLHREMVLKGQGVSVLPEFMIGEDLRKKRLSDLYPEEKFVFEMKIAALKGHAFSPPAQRLIDRLAVGQF